MFRGMENLSQMVYDNIKRYRKFIPSILNRQRNTCQNCGGCDYPVLNYVCNCWRPMGCLMVWGIND